MPCKNISLGAFVAFFESWICMAKRVKAGSIVMKVCIFYTYCTLFHTIVALNSFFSVLAVPLTNKNL
jgi:hypothetical protein